MQPRPSGADRCGSVCYNVLLNKLGIVPVPQFREHVAEVVTVVLQERISWCVSSDITDDEGITSLGLENPTYCFLDNTRVLSSAGMTSLSVNSGSHCQRSGETSGMIYDCNFRPSGRPRKRRRRMRCSSRGRVQRQSKRDGRSHRGVSHCEDCQNREMSVTTHAGKQLLGFWSNITPEMQKKRRH